MPSLLHACPGLSWICPSISQNFCHLFGFLHSANKHPLPKGTSIQGSIRFFTCFHFTGIFFFPSGLWLLVEMLDSQSVPGDRSAGRWPDSPGGISKMQLNFCSLIRPTSLVWAPALHGLELPKVLHCLSPVHPEWPASRAVIFSFLSLSTSLLMTSTEIAFLVSHVSQPF